MSDSGTATITRVVVGVSMSAGSGTTLCRAACEARHRGAELWPVLAWLPPGGDLSARRFPPPADLLDSWRHLAGQTLLTALDAAFGATGPGVPVRAVVARGTPGAALVDIADRDTDLLVVGSGRRGLLHGVIARPVSRHCLAHVGCAVLAVPASPLEAELAALHRRNRWRLRLDTRPLARKTVRPGS